MTAPDRGFLKEGPPVTAPDRGFLEVPPDTVPDQMDFNLPYNESPERGGREEFQFESQEDQELSGGVPTRQLVLNIEHGWSYKFRYK